MELEIRHLPDQDPLPLFDEVKAFMHEKLLPAMHAVDPSTGFQWKAVAEYPGPSTPEHAEITQLGKSLTGTNRSFKAAFGTEAGLFHQAGVPTVICGPGSIRQAPTPDEFVSLEQVQLCETFLGMLMDRICRR